MRLVLISSACCSPFLFRTRSKYRILADNEETSPKLKATIHLYASTSAPVHSESSVQKLASNVHFEVSEPLILKGVLQLLYEIDLLSMSYVEWNI